MGNLEDDYDLEPPFSEFHSRKSRRRLAFSGPDANGVVECHRCRKRFPDLVHFYAHAKESLIVGIKSVRPLHKFRGRWVKREYFRGENSFGFFQCCNCTRLRNERTVWMSAYAYKHYGQGCAVCNDKQWMTATFLWQNYPDPTRKRKSRGKKDYSGHKKELCEACDLGVCRYRTWKIE